MCELELIKKAQSGNRSALNMLLNDNMPILKGYVIKMTGNPQLSQDIIQDTLLKVIINIKKYEPKAKLSTWIIKIATNVYKDYLRKNHPGELIEETLEDRSQDVEETAITNYEYREIMNILQKLSHEKRSVFILKHYYGYKYEEIAAILNCPVGTVRSRLHNAVKFILDELEKRDLI